MDGLLRKDSLFSKTVAVLFAIILTIGMMPGLAFAEGGDTASTIDNSTTLPDGIYTSSTTPALTSSFEGGTGKVSIVVDQVEVTSGKAMATVSFMNTKGTKVKTTYSKVVTGGVTYGKASDGTTDGSTDAPSTFVFPIDLNSTQTITGTTSAMSESHDIEYTITTAIDEPTPSDDTIGDVTLSLAGATVADGTTVTVTGDNEYDAHTATADGTVKVHLVLGGTDATSITVDGKTVAAKDGAFDFTITVEQLNTELAVTAGDATGTVKVNYTPALLDQLVNNVAVQSENDATDRMCDAAHACWNGLTDEQKAEFDSTAENAGWFSTDDPVGTTSADEVATVCSAPTKSKEILVVSFGTSFNTSRNATVGAVEKALQAAYPDYDVRRGFTSQIIINHVHARDGVNIDGVEEALAKAEAAGVTELVVQPTTLMNGAEYKEMREAVAPYESKMKVVYSDPLLHSLSDQADPTSDDAATTAEYQKAVVEATTSYAVSEAGYDSLDAAKKDGTAFVYMGHGTSDEAAKTYTETQSAVDSLGYDNVFIGTVEGKPASTSVINVFKAVKAAGYSKVVIRPLMVVAGDHANNDMAGDDADSWKSAFVNGGHYEGEAGTAELGEGFGADNVDCQVEGLGQIPAVQQMYVQRVAKALAYENAIPAGTYKISGDDLFNAIGDKMFKTKDSLLVSDGTNAVLYLDYASNSVSYMYPGTANEAKAAVTAAGGVANAASVPGIIAGAQPDNIYAIPITAQYNNEITFASNSASYFRKGENKWYTRHMTLTPDMLQKTEQWTRLSGDTRYDTMAAIDQAGYADGSASKIIVASGENFPDALSAAGLSGVLNAPVILTSGTTLSDQAASEIERVSNGSAEVYVLGGEVAMSKDVENAVSNLKGVKSVERLAGALRTDTAMAIYNAGAGKWGDTAIVVDAYNFPDALSVAPYAAYAGDPIFGTNGNGGVLTDAEVQAIKAGGFKNILVIGGDAVVDYSGVQAQLGSDYTYMRLFGNTRYDTSAEIVKWTTGTGEANPAIAPSKTMSFNGMAVSSATNFPDALSGVNLLGHNGTVLLLVDDYKQDVLDTTNSNINTIIAAANKGTKYKGYIFGGEKAVSPSLEQAIVDATK